MHQLKQGEFYGAHYQQLNFADFQITDTEYTHRQVDWHYHENPYFTYLLQGKLLEANKKETYYLKPGSLLFHHWQDAHYNVKPEEYTRGFHVELSAEWFQQYDLKITDMEGSIHLQNPLIKGLLNRTLFESKINDDHSRASIELLLVDAFGLPRNEQAFNRRKPPLWLSIPGARYSERHLGEHPRRAYCQQRKNHLRAIFCGL